MAVEIWQRWRRKNGSIVVITDERTNRNLREVLLVPEGDGRKSWKWDEAVDFEMTRVE